MTGPLAATGLLDTICGYTAVRAGAANVIYLVGSGFDPSRRIYLFTTTALDTVDADTGRFVDADVYGNGFFDLANAGTTGHIYILHGSTATGAAARISNSVGLSWGPAPNPIPVYSPSVPVLDPPVAGDREVYLTWPASAACDPRRDAVVYDLQRSSTGPSSGYATIASSLTSPAYHDVGLINEQTYWYRARSRTTYLNHLIPASGDFPSAFGDPGVAATPTLRRESWGMLAA